MKQISRIVIACVAVLVSTTQVGAQCWRYDMTCCKMCDGEAPFPCSDCGPPTYFGCCAIIWVSNVIPTRTTAIYESGYKVVGTTITTVQGFCSIEAMTPNEACNACVRTGVYFTKEKAIDNPPAYNCPPA